MERPIPKLNPSISSVPMLISGLGIIVVFFIFFPFFRAYNTVIYNNIASLVASTVLSVVFITYQLISVSIGRKSIVLTLLDILVILYFGIFTLQTIVQYNEINPVHIIDSFVVVILYLFFRNIKTSQISTYLFILPIAAIFQILYGIKYQTDFFMPGYRLSDISGTYFNSGILSGFTAISFIATIWLLYFYKHGRLLCRKYYLFGIIVLIIFLIPQSTQLLGGNSRAAWLSTLVGLLFVIYERFVRYSFNKISNIKKALFVLVAILILIPSCIFLYNLKKDSANGRLLIWEISLEMIKDKPIYGYGINGFKSNYMNYQAEFFAKNPTNENKYLAGDNLYAFNELIRIQIEKGIIGIGIAISIIMLSLFGKNKAPSKRQLTPVIVKSILASLYVFSCFSYPLETFQLKLITIQFLAFRSNYLRAILTFDLKPPEKVSHKLLKLAGVSLVIVFVLGWILSNLSKQMVALKNWDNNLEQFYKNSSINILKDMHPVSPQLKSNGVYLSSYGKLLVTSGQYEKAVTILIMANKYLPSSLNYIELGKSYIQLGDYDKATTALNTASLMVPVRFEPNYLLAKMYYHTGEISKAQSIASLLVQKEVKIWSPRLQYFLDEMEDIINESKK